jgi:threonine dehydratase
VVCASAGNHAQGVAYAARQVGVESTVFMPIFAPPAKIQATQGYGARVHLTGTIFDEAYAAARIHAEERDQVFIPAFDDPHIIAGQGTVGLEIYEDLRDVDLVFCPVGGGGLIAGVALAMKHLNPGIQVIGVEAEGAQSMYLSLRLGRIESMNGMSTIADGIAVKTPGELTFPMVQQYVDDLVTVTDEETGYAMFLLAQRAKLIAEPAGIVGMAAVLGGKVDVAGKRVAVIISGGNVNLALFSQIIERGLIKDGLRAEIAVDVPDLPGKLIQLLSILADLQANIVDITHDRNTTSVPIGFVRITISFRTLGTEQVTSIARALDARNLRYQVLF